MSSFDLKILNKSKVFLDGCLLERKQRPKSCRYIYMNDFYVVKIEWVDTGDWMGQCLQEYQLWNKIKKIEEDKKFFLPILYFKENKKYDVIIQPKIQMEKMRKRETAEKFWKKGIGKMVRKYKLDDLENCKFRNWGVWNGNPVIFDYGCTQ